MTIKRIYKRITGILLSLAVLFLATPVTAFAAPDIDIICAANTSANAGNTVNVTISTTSGASISTLGLRLYYDNEKLTYQGSQWVEKLKNSNSTMTLVSDVPYSGSQVLNISMIADGGYQSGSTFVTLAFTVKEGYTENPFKLELREITDENLQNISPTTNIVYQSIGKGINEPDAKSTTVSSKDTLAEDAPKTTAKTNHSKTFQTGVRDFGTDFLFIGVVLELAGIVCIIIRRKLLG